MLTITCNGIQIYYELHGPSDAPVLVLNNGILMNAASSWTPQTTAFAASYRGLETCVFNQDTDVTVFNACA